MDETLCDLIQANSRFPAASPSGAPVQYSSHSNNLVDTVMAKARHGGYCNFGDGGAAAAGGSSASEPPTDTGFNADLTVTSDLTDDILDTDLILRSIGISDDYAASAEDLGNRLGPYNKTHPCAPPTVSHVGGTNRLGQQTATATNCMSNKSNQLTSSTTSSTDEYVKVDMAQLLSDATTQLPLWSSSSPGSSVGFSSSLPTDLIGMISAKQENRCGRFGRSEPAECYSPMTLGTASSGNLIAPAHMTSSTSAAVINSPTSSAANFRIPASTCNISSSSSLQGSSLSNNMSYSALNKPTHQQFATVKKVFGNTSQSTDIANIGDVTAPSVDTTTTGCSVLSALLLSSNNDSSVQIMAGGLRRSEEGLRHDSGSSSGGVDTERQCNDTEASLPNLLLEDVDMLDELKPDPNSGSPTTSNRQLCGNLVQSHGELLLTQSSPYNYGSVPLKSQLSTSYAMTNPTVEQKVRLELRCEENVVFTVPSALPHVSHTELGLLELKPNVGSTTTSPIALCSTSNSDSSACSTSISDHSPATDIAMSVWGLAESGLNSQQLKQQQPQWTDTSPRVTPRPSPQSTPPPVQFEVNNRHWKRTGRSTPTSKRSRPQTPTSASEGELSDGGYREREPHSWRCVTPVETKPQTRLEDMVDEDKYNKRKRSGSGGDRGQGRKDPIKIMLDQLQSKIPHIGNPDEEKVSHAGLLIEGSEYIESLMRENKSTKENVEALKVKIEELNLEIEASQERLPEHGTTAIHRILSTRGKSIPDMFADHVRQRTQEDWRYWVFTSIMGHFVHSFAQEVSNISPREMHRTTMDWLQERMSLQLLRKDAYRKLAKLCSKTSIMENPAKLPEEARGFVDIPEEQSTKEEIEEDPPAFRRVSTRNLI